MHTRTGDHSKINAILTTWFSANWDRHFWPNDKVTRTWFFPDDAFKRHAVDALLDFNGTEFRPASVKPLQHKFAAVQEQANLGRRGSVA